MLKKLDKNIIIKEIENFIPNNLDFNEWLMIIDDSSQDFNSKDELLNYLENLSIYQLVLIDSIGIFITDEIGEFHLKDLIKIDDITKAG